MYRDLPYPRPSSPATSAVMRGNRPRDTSPEVRVRSLLHRGGYRFRKDFPIRVHGLRRSVRPDIAFTAKRVAVFVDGCFWHVCPEHGHMPRANPGYWRPKLERNVQRDLDTTRLLTDTGWRVVRVWEHATPDEAMLQIIGTLDSDR